MLRAPLSAMRYFDAHCHVQFPMYDEDRAAVLAAMQEALVGGLIVGTDVDSSAKAVALADGETFFASVGLHPNYVSREEYHPSLYEGIATDEKVRAIGECGFDFFRPEDADAAKTKQKEVFAAHIALAAATEKPLMIHARPSKGSMDAYEDALSMVEEAKREHPGLSGNFHFFVGNRAIAERIVASGFTCSFTAVLTFTRDYDEVVRSLPLASILAETDAPYVAPAPNRGKRNDPLAVREVVHAIAGIRGEAEEAVRVAVLENAKRLFRF